MLVDLHEPFTPKHALCYAHVRKRAGKVSFIYIGQKHTFASDGWRGSQCVTLVGSHCLQHTKLCASNPYFTLILSMNASMQCVHKCQNKMYSMHTSCWTPPSHSALHKGNRGAAGKNVKLIVDGGETAPITPESKDIG